MDSQCGEDGVCTDGACCTKASCGIYCGSQPGRLRWHDVLRLRIGRDLLARSATHGLADRLSADVRSSRELPRQ